MDIRKFIFKRAYQVLYDHFQPKVGAPAALNIALNIIFVRAGLRRGFTLGATGSLPRHDFEFILDTLPSLEIDFIRSYGVFHMPQHPITSKTTLGQALGYLCPEELFTSATNFDIINPLYIEYRLLIGDQELEQPSIQFIAFKCRRLTQARERRLHEDIKSMQKFIDRYDIRFNEQPIQIIGVSSRRCRKCRGFYHDLETGILCDACDQGAIDNYYYSWG